MSTGQSVRRRWNVIRWDPLKPFEPATVELSCGHKLSTIQPQWMVSGNQTFPCRTCTRKRRARA